MEYDSAIKRSTVETVLMRWLNLETIIQSEVSQQNKYCIRSDEISHSVTHICVI